MILFVLFICCTGFNILRCSFIFTHLESQFFVSETHIFRWDFSLEEHIDTLSHRHWESDHTIGTWSSIKAANEVRQIV